MRPFRSLDDLIHEFRQVDSDQVPSVAAELLTHDVDWAGIASRWITTLTDDQFVNQVLQEHIREVEPRIFLLHDEPGRFQLVLHHFDRVQFDFHYAAGRIGPHYHHFSFATRILRGSYHHVLFDNLTGQLEQPTLEVRGIRKQLTGDCYLMPWDQFHCVLGPDHDSVSFMVRGPAVVDPGHPPDPLYTPQRILEARNTLMTALSGCPPPCIGRFTDIESAGIGHAGTPR